ncbi:transcription elongation factor GreA [Anaerolineales bacterium]
MEQIQYLTREGLDELNKRLQYFIEVRRPAISQRLSQAMEDGGELNENPEYEDAKNQQAFIEAEIARLTQIIRNARIIQKKQTDHVEIGSQVKVIESGYDEEETYLIVGSAEANPSEGKISSESPLGRALLNAKVGDKVKVKAPDGALTFTIQAIE